ncbi:hypothetical protein [Streptomyces sp. NPDC005476]|uniref:hypothetical protein n=1 Tax=Streptomyces sp. NPDC005476 TaxID=3156882 RepID=UPI0034519177
MEQLAKIGFVAQDTPACAALSVADHLDFGIVADQRLSGPGVPAAQDERFCAGQESVDHTLTGAASVMQRQM